MAGELKRELGFWDLVLFHTTAIIGLRWISIAASNGWSSLPLWALAFACFFLPQAFVLLQLSRKWPLEGGLYQWTKQALGPLHGFVSGWCYFFNNLTYYPSVLITAAGYSTFIWYSRMQGMEENKTYLFVFCLVALWVVLILNMVGLRIGKWVQNVGGVSTWIPASIVILLGILFVSSRGSATPVSGQAFIPTWNVDTLTFWAYICFAFAGFELITMLGGEVKNAERNIPRSIVVAGAIATTIYIVGTTCLIVSLPNEKISKISGILQVIAEQGRVFNLVFLSNVLAVLLILGQFGAVGAWLSGSGRALYSVGVDRYVPKIFSRIHPRWGTPHYSILVQGVISSVFLLIANAGATQREFWQLLLSSTTIIYFIPYLYLFVAYFALMRKGEVPWNLKGLAASVFGFLATLISIIVSLLPPEEGNKWLYEAKIIGGSLVTVGIGLLLYWRAQKRQKLEVRMQNQ